MYTGQVRERRVLMVGLELGEVLHLRMKSAFP